MCYHFKFGSSASKGVHINRREPRKLGSAGTPARWGGGFDEPIKTSPLPICVSVSKLVRINRKELQNWGALRHVILPNLVVLGQAVRALWIRSPWNFGPSRPAFQGHSRSSEPTQIDPPPMKISHRHYIRSWELILFSPLSRRGLNPIKPDGQTDGWTSDDSKDRANAYRRAVKVETKICNLISPLR